MSIRPLYSRSCTDSASVLKFKINNSSGEKFTIYTNSLSYLQALKYTKLEHPLIKVVTYLIIFNKM